MEGEIVNFFDWNLSYALVDAEKRLSTYIRKHDKLCKIVFLHETSFDRASSNGTPCRIASISKFTRQTLVGRLDVTISLISSRRGRKKVTRHRDLLFTYTDLWCAHARCHVYTSADNGDVYTDADRESMSRDKSRSRWYCPENYPRWIVRAIDGSSIATPSQRVGTRSCNTFLHAYARNVSTCITVYPRRYSCIYSVSRNASLRKNKVNRFRLFHFFTFSG